MRYKALLLLLTSLLFFTPFKVFSQGGDDIKIRVHLSVSGSENIRGEVTSYLSRELRSLKNVALVDERPDIMLSVIAMESRSKGGYKTGIVFSVIVQQPFNDVLLYTVAAGLNNKQIDFLIDATKDSYNILGHWIQTGSPDEVKELSQKLIADFDGDYLEDIRKVRESNLERRKRSQRK